MKTVIHVQLQYVYMYMYIYMLMVNALFESTNSLAVCTDTCQSSERTYNTTSNIQHSRVRVWFQGDVIGRQQTPCPFLKLHLELCLLQDKTMDSCFFSFSCACMQGLVKHRTAWSDIKLSGFSKPNSEFSSHCITIILLLFVSLSLFANIDLLGSFCQSKSSLSHL